MAEGVSPVPAWYGKIPSLGDFASRRLPPHFIDVWHDWLQQGMAASRASLGERWLDIYLNSPIWRFLVMPGVCGESLWTGTLMPSVDKVGRYFPLSLVVQADASSVDLAGVMAAEAWYSALEQLSLAMLDVNVSADDLERGLAATPFPAHDAALMDNAQQFIQWWGDGDAAPKVINLARPAAVNELIQAVALQGLTVKGRGKSLWWTAHQPKLHCFPQLPPASYFSVLLENSADA